MQRPSCQGLLRYCLLLTGSAPVQRSENCKHVRNRRDETLWTLVLIAPLVLSGVVTPTTSVHAQQVNSDSTLSLIKECDLVYQHTRSSADPDIRKSGVNFLAQACTQGNIEVTGVALRYLKAFTLADFTRESKEKIKLLVDDTQPYLKEAIMIASFLQLHDLVPRLKVYAGPGHPNAIRWAAITGLARMGDRDANEGMMIRVKRLPVNDEVVYNVFPDLVYSRTPEALSHLVEALYSDENNCLSPDAESDARIPCAYRVMEQLASVVAAFPLVLDENGDLQTDDYPEALEISRQWFRENPTYGILTDSY